MDSDYYGSAGEQDTSLVSPVIDMSSLTDPVLGFKQDYNNLGDIADVDVSVDGGATWETVLHQTTDVRGPREDVLPLPMAAGESDVQVRFHSTTPATPGGGRSTTSSPATAPATRCPAASSSATCAARPGRPASTARP